MVWGSCLELNFSCETLLDKCGFYKPESWSEDKLTKLLSSEKGISLREASRLAQQASKHLSRLPTGIALLLTGFLLLSPDKECTWSCISRPFPAILSYRMESNRIRMESDLDSIFYHILTRIRIRILSDTMQNGCLEFEYGLGYLLWFGT